MNIALVRQEYRAAGGAELFTARLISALQEDGHRVTLIARHWPADDSLRAICCNPPRWGRLLRDWGFSQAVQYVLRRQRFDLVQSNERVPGCDVYRAGDGVHRQWLEERGRTQSAAARWAVAASPYHRYLLWAERQVLEHPKLRAVICNSRMVRDEISRHFRIDPAKLHVVYNGVDTTRFAPNLKQHRDVLRRSLGVPADAPLFAFVGSGFERKGLRMAIEALAQLPAAHLVVVGYEKSRWRFDWLARRLGVRKRVHFAGVQADVGPYYGAADALVLPTLYDPFPNVVMEAMASGLPALVSRQCGAAELVEPDLSGHVCDALDRTAWVAAMKQLSDPTLAGRMGAAARRRVEPYTLSAMTEQLDTLYRELLP
ncbi:MAG: glycosyltransferase family 4 protein [Planctomycetia bacterium]|nr:glycosyltransferase family 4 protein [Planctomycetia bacterium]